MIAISASTSVAADVDRKTALHFTYFGAAGWSISDGNVTVLVDPYISRIPYTDRRHPDDGRRAFARDEVGVTDTELVDSLVTDADFIKAYARTFSWPESMGKDRPRLWPWMIRSFLK